MPSSFVSRVIMKEKNGSWNLFRFKEMPRMALQTLRADRFFSSLQDSFTLLTRTREKGEQLPGTFSTFFLALAFFSGLILTSLGPLYAEEKLPLTSGPVEPSLKTTNEFIEIFTLKPQVKTVHGLITFPGRYVTQDERSRLTKFGIHVLEFYRNTTYWVRVDRAVATHKLKNLNIKLFLTKLQDEDRVHPDLWNLNYSNFIVRQPGNQPPVNYVLNENGTLNLTIMFHIDVTERQAKTVIKRYAQTVKKKSNMVWIVLTRPTAVPALAQEDLVRWIDAGPIPAYPENDNTRRAIKIDNVQNYNATTGSGAWMGGWTNSGIRVGVFDFGINDGHPDFGDRVKIPDLSRNDGHGTRVAGTVAGSGLKSVGNIGCGVTGSDRQWRGMAPAAYVHEEWWEKGDDVTHHSNRITSPGMHLSNHSYKVSDDGDYSPSDRLRDEIIKGVRPGGTPLCGFSSFCPRLHVYSAGNTGDPCPTGLCPALPYQSGYFALSKQVKNAIVVGNWDYISRADSTIQATAAPNQIHNGATTDGLGSSLGPAHDGRIKPDVVAPGTDVCSTRDTGSYYGNMTGTSMSAAAVSGSVATLLQQYANIYHVSDLNKRAPLPSTLRAVLIHTAEDIKVDDAPPPWFSNADGPVKPTPGPDFVTGWGLVNLEKAHPIVAKQYLREDSVSSQCEAKVYYFSAGTDPFRVTLAWDDPPYAGPALPRTDRRLVNDLDLVLIDPNGGIHYSWKIDQTIIDPSNGVPIPDDGQLCSTPINQENISRQFLPTDDPEHHNDDTTQGIPSAVRGRDHLNNVEVVDIDMDANNPAIPGVWQAQVTVFHLDSYWGSQPFSLVGNHFLSAIPPASFCSASPLLCTGLSNPWSVAVPDTASHKITGKFPSSNATNIVSMKALCELGVINCPPCTFTKRCPRFDIRLERMTTPLYVSVFSDKGRLMKRDTSDELAKTISFKARANEEYFLVLSPATGTEIGKEFHVSLAIGE